MNIECPKCNTIFEFFHKKQERTNLKFKCSVCGHIWQKENKSSAILKKPVKTNKPSYRLLIILNVVIILFVLIGFFWFREELEFIDSYWEKTYLFFDSLVPVQ